MIIEYVVCKVLNVKGELIGTRLINRKAMKVDDSKIADYQGRGERLEEVGVVQVMGDTVFLDNVYDSDPLL